VIWPFVFGRQRFTGGLKARLTDWSPRVNEQYPTGHCEFGHHAARRGEGEFAEDANSATAQRAIETYAARSRCLTGSTRHYQHTKDACIPRRSTRVGMRLRPAEQRAMRALYPPVVVHYRGPCSTAATLAARGLLNQAIDRFTSSTLVFNFFARAHSREPVGAGAMRARTGQVDARNTTPGDHDFKRIMRDGPENRQ